MIDGGTAFQRHRACAPLQGNVPAENMPGMTASSVWFPPPRESLIQMVVPIDSERAQWIKEWDAARDKFLEMDNG